MIEQNRVQELRDYIRDHNLDWTEISKNCDISIHDMQESSQTAEIILRCLREEGDFNIFETFDPFGEGITIEGAK